MAVQIRVATFNVENLFDRPKVFMEDNPADGDTIMKEIAAFDKQMNKATYDKVKLLALYKKVKDYVDLFEIRGKKLLNRTRTKVVAKGRGDWPGWFRFKRTKFSDKTAKKIRRRSSKISILTCFASSRPRVAPCSTISAPRGWSGLRVERSSASITTCS